MQVVRVLSRVAALVHDTWLKLGDQTFENRAYVFAAAAEAMRRILVDNARRKQSVKHGGAMQRANWSSLDLAAEAGVDDVVLIAALALHRRMSEAELRHALGDRLRGLQLLRGQCRLGQRQRFRQTDERGQWRSQVVRER